MAEESPGGLKESMQAQGYMAFFVKSSEGQKLLMPHAPCLREGLVPFPLMSSGGKHLRRFGLIGNIVTKCYKRITSATES